MSKRVFMVVTWKELASRSRHVSLEAAAMSLENPEYGGEDWAVVEVIARFKRETKTEVKVTQRA